MSPFQSDVNQQEKSGMTALHACAVKDLPGPAEVLLVHRGAKPRLLDKKGRPPLHYAVMKHRNKVARIINDYLNNGDRDGIMWVFCFLVPVGGLCL